MKAVFLSDVHLKHTADERYTLIMEFFSKLLDGKVRSLVNDEAAGQGQTAIEHLFILGDFFDFWFCTPDRIYPQFQPVINKLIEIRKSGVSIHFCEGNHDFFMKEYFQDILGMNVYEQWATIELDHLRLLISHGDTADSSDRSYLLFRKFLRSRFFYLLQGVIPARLRWFLASTTSNASKRLNDGQSDYLAEKMQAFATKKLSGDYDAVIMGHCHKPLLRYFDAGGRKKTFIALGDWITYHSFVYYENRRFYMSCYKGQG